MALMVVMVSKMYAYPQTHQVVYIKYVQLFTCKSSLIKVVYKKLSHKKNCFGDPNYFAYSDKF